MAEPFPICYLNGAWLPIDEARISPFDRGFLYADGAYEVMPVYSGRPFRFESHSARLTRSLSEIQMEDPRTRDEWRKIIGEMVARNPSKADQYVYWQVTRGAERGRNHAPLPKISRTVFAFCAPLPDVGVDRLSKGLECVTAQDTRWSRCDIKSVSLLANVLLRQISAEAGAAETILLRDGELIEGSASAVHAVIGGELRSPPNSRKLLPGTTRSVIEEMAQRAAIPFRSTRITEAELRGADEICLSAATREIQPVTWLDGKTVGGGRPGPMWRRLHDEFQLYKRELANQPW